MNIFDHFRTATTTPNPAAPGNPATQAPAGAAANPSLPSGTTPVNQPGGPAAFPAVPAISDQEKSPMSGFEKLWDIDTEAAKKAAAAANPVPEFTFDATKLKAAVDQMDFAGTIDPALMKRITDGDSTALAEALNTVGRNAFSNSAQATNRIVEKAVQATAKKMMDDVLPSMLNKHAVNSHLREQNPVLDNPAIAPIAKMIGDAVIAKNPNASAADINSQVRQYLAGFAKTLEEAKMIGNADASGEQSVKVSRKSGGNADNWEDFFGVGS